MNERLDAEKCFVVVVLVTYEPKHETLKNTLLSLITQVKKIILIDNSDQEDSVAKELQFEIDSDKIDIFCQTENLGIAKAQNIGIMKGLDLGADFIVLSDQDTLYPLDYIEIMLRSYYSVNGFINVAAIAPEIKEMHNDGIKMGFIMFDSYSRKTVHYQRGCHEITQAISSGLLIKADFFKRIGLLDEKLFIDGVDFEWCWRARAKGFRIFGCVDTSIEHFLGDKVEEFNKKRYTIRSPLRHYYMIRNGIHLALRSPDINLGMKLKLTFEALRLLITFSLIGKPPIKHFKYTTLGLFHGLINKMGKL